MQTQHAPDPPRPHNQTNNDSSQPALPGSQPPINSTSLQIKNISVCLQTQHAPDPPCPHNQINNDSSQPALPGN